MKEINNNTMLKPIILKPTPANLQVRLQAPALLAPKQGEMIETTETLDGWDLQSGEIKAQVRITNQSSGYFEITACITNHGDKSQEVRFSYPYLFYHFDYKGAARIFDPTFGGILEAKNSGIKVHYPGFGSFCLTGATVPGCAIGLGVFNLEQRHVDIRHYPALNNGGMRFNLERVYVKAGEKLELPVSFIQIGESWGEAFAPYKEWVAAHFNRTRAIPEWFLDGGFTGTRKAHCASSFAPADSALGLWLFNNEGVSVTMDDLKKEIDEACADYAKRGLKPLFYQFGWWKAMDTMQGVFPFDAICGDYSEANRLIKDSIRYIHEKGGRVYLYANSIAVGDESQAFHHAPSILIRNAAGLPVYNTDYPMYLLCPGSPGIRSYWERIVHHIIIELDADGIFLDQIGGGCPPEYCYDPDHQHKHPDTYGQDIIGMIDDIVQMVKALKPDAIVSGELCHDVRSLYLDEAHGRDYGFGMKNYIPEAAEARRDTEPTEYYAFLKYISPGIRSQSENMVHVMDGSPGHADQAYYERNKAIFDYGFVPCKTEFPGAIAYLYGDPLADRAILAVRCHTSLKQVRVQLPRKLQFIAELDLNAKSVEHDCILVDVNEKSQYYMLQKLS